MRTSAVTGIGTSTSVRHAHEAVIPDTAHLFRISPCLRMGGTQNQVVQGCTDSHVVDALDDRLGFVNKQ